MKVYHKNIEVGQRSVDLLVDVKVMVEPKALINLEIGGHGNRAHKNL